MNFAAAQTSSHVSCVTYTSINHHYSAPRELHSAHLNNSKFYVNNSKAENHKNHSQNYEEQPSTTTLDHDSPSGMSRPPHCRHAIDTQHRH
eukprot:6492173-Amphidinium_carterae.1